MFFLPSGYVFDNVVHAFRHFTKSRILSHVIAKKLVLPSSALVLIKNLVNADRNLDILNSNKKARNVG